MAQFIPLERFEGMQRQLPGTSATVVVKGALLKFSSGYLTNASAGDSEVDYLALESKTLASTGELVEVLAISGDTVFQAECGTTPVQASHVGNDYDLAGASTIDLTATADKVFRIDSIKNATDKLVIGRFNKPAIA